MKRLLTGVILTTVLYYAISCNKVSDLSQQPTINATDARNSVLANFTSVSVKFGVIVNKAYDSGINAQGFPRINAYTMGSTANCSWAFDTLKVRYYRLAVNQDSWNDTVAQPNYRTMFMTRYREAYDKGLSILLNCNYWGPSNSDMDYPDSTTYKNWLRKVLDSLGSKKPAVVVIENEECGGTYNNSTATQVQAYVNELKGGATLCRSRSIAVTNGGLTNVLLAMLTYDSFKPDTAKANTFARKVFSPTLATQLIAGSFNSRINRWKTAVSSSGYGSCGLSYINMHWYEPAYLANWNDALDGSPIARGEDTTTAQLSKVINFCTTATGISGIMSNEVGQTYASSCLTNDYLSELNASPFSIICWYDGDGDDKYDAKALHSTTAAGVAKRRTMGTAFKQWMAGTGSVCQ